MRKTLIIGLLVAVGALGACGGSSATAVPTSAARTPAAATVAPAATQTAAPANATQALGATDTVPPLETGSAPTPNEPGDTPAGTGAVVGFCSLLTSAEVSAVLNEAVSDPTPDTNNCGWTPISFSGPSATFIIEGLAVSDFNDLKGVSGVVNTSLPKLGDEAYTQTIAPGVTSLYVRKGSTAIQLSVLGNQMTDADQSAFEIALAAKAVARL